MMQLACRLCLCVMDTQESASRLVYSPSLQASGSSQPPQDLHSQGFPLQVHAPVPDRH